MELILFLENCVQFFLKTNCQKIFLNFDIFSQIQIILYYFNLLIEISKMDIFSDYESNKKTMSHSVPMVTFIILGE